MGGQDRQPGKHRNPIVLLHWRGVQPGSNESFRMDRPAALPNRDRGRDDHRLEKRTARRPGYGLLSDRFLCLQLDARRGVSGWMGLSVVFTPRLFVPGVRFDRLTWHWPSNIGPKRLNYPSPKAPRY